MDVLSLSVHLVLPLVLRRPADRPVHGSPRRLGPLQPLLQVEAAPHPSIQPPAPEPPPTPGRLWEERVTDYGFPSMLTGDSYLLLS